MKYAYEDMSPEQFEDLIVFICQRLLGISVQVFSTGPDGARDAKFLGTAELHPSKADPWKGTVIIQGKHTNGYNKYFNEPDFYSRGAKTNVIAKEVPRIKTLRNGKKLDHYMLFANRRLSANAESEIREHISKECGIPEASIYLCGVEQLEMLLKRFPDAARLAGLDPIDSPLIVSPDELAEVIEALAIFPFPGFRTRIRIGSTICPTDTLKNCESGTSKKRHKLANFLHRPKTWNSKENMER